MKHLPKFALSESSMIMREYSGHKEPMEKSLYRLEAVMHERARDKKRAQNRQLTPIQFLAQVREWLPQMMTDTQTDYISTTRTYNKLLKCVRRKIHQQLGHVYP